MLQGPIKELFYSNGVDVFGPVDMDEFCKNRYYKSTLVWYEGLAGWINIGDSEDLKHLIGTMATLNTDGGVPHALPSITPPLSKKQYLKPESKIKYIGTIVALAVLFLILLTYSIINHGDENSTLNPIALTDSMIPDSATILLKNVKSDAEKKTYRLNWEKFVMAVPNDFKVKEIGGIEDLKINLKNNSPYTLDSVKVKVVFVKANNEVFQTEILQFDNVIGNSVKELFAPSSSRGVKVNCSIISIHSKEMQLCVDRQNGQNKTGEDPYFCQ